MPVAGNNKFLHNMFAEFMQIQATNTTPKSKSEHTADPEIFSGDSGNTEIIHEKLESFIMSLSLKMTLNTDRYPTETSQIVYIFSCMTGTAQSYISAKITAGQYIDWHNIIQDLWNTFSNPDPEFLAQRKLIALRQANYFFAEFFTEFNQYALHTGFNNKTLKCHLQYTVSEELTKQLVSINLKDISYQKLVEECQLQDNQLHATFCQLLPSTSSTSHPSLSSTVRSFSSMSRVHQASLHTTATKSYHGSQPL